MPPSLLDSRGGNVRKWYGEHFAFSGYDTSDETRGATFRARRTMGAR